MTKNERLMATDCVAKWMSEVPDEHFQSVYAMQRGFFRGIFKHISPISRESEAVERERDYYTEKVRHLVTTLSLTELKRVFNFIIHLT